MQEHVFWLAGTAREEAVVVAAVAIVEVVEGVCTVGVVTLAWIMERGAVVSTAAIAVSTQLVGALHLGHQPELWRLQEIVQRTRVAVVIRRQQTVNI